MNIKLIGFNTQLFCHTMSLPFNASSKILLKYYIISQLLFLSSPFFLIQKRSILYINYRFKMCSSCVFFFVLLEICSVHLYNIYPSGFSFRHKVSFLISWDPFILLPTVQPVVNLEIPEKPSTALLCQHELTA